MSLALSILEFRVGGLPGAIRVPDTYPFMAETDSINGAQRPMADAIRAGGDGALAPVFSRNRGFNRRLKRHGDGRATLDDE